MKVFKKLLNWLKEFFSVVPEPHIYDYPKGFTVWFTGLSGSGKTTLAQKLSDRLLSIGVPNIEILDGDEIRKTLNKDLGFSKEDRDENIRRVAFISRLLTKNCVASLAVCISPYRAMRDFSRSLIKDFIEVYVRCSKDELIKRDTKGLYAKAIAGEIKLTGMCDEAPYEEPLNPEVIVDTDKQTIDECVDKIIAKLKELNYV